MWMTGTSPVMTVRAMLSPYPPGSPFDQERVNVRRLGLHHDQPPERHPLYRRNQRHRPARLGTPRRSDKGLHETLRTQTPRLHGTLRGYPRRDPAREEHEALFARLEDRPDFGSQP